MKVLHNIKISSTFAASIKEMVTFDGEIAQLVRAHDSYEVPGSIPGLATRKKTS